MWPSRFHTDADAQPYVSHPVALANVVYDRPKEGNVKPGDGWLFRGGGDIGLTFRNNFRAVGQMIGVDLENHPELIEQPAIAVLTGLACWKMANVNRYFDAGTPKRARGVLNAGNPDFPNPIGWDDVLARYNRLLAAQA